MIVIREADKYDAMNLTSIAMRSKAHWGYSDAFMKGCRKELLVTEDDIENNNNYYAIAKNSEEIRGFYAIKKLADSIIELDALFVEPEYIGTGIGRLLIEHAKNQATLDGGRTLVFQSDPNAKEFYKAVGATLTGEQESSCFPGRFLPTFSISLTG